MALVVALAAMASTALARPKKKKSRAKKPAPTKTSVPDQAETPTPDQATASAPDQATASAPDQAKTSAPDRAKTSAPDRAKTPPPDQASGGDADEIEIDPNDADKPGAGSGSGDVNPDEIDMGEPDQQGDLSADLEAEAERANAVTATPRTKTPLSWQDIVVVIRKPFLKQYRWEFLPLVGTTMNDNMIRHYTVGGEIAYYLTDVLAVGVEGLYYAHSFREPFDLVARQARRLPTINQYNWSAALNFHYVPVYGKFAVLDRKLVTWEASFTAGIGAGQSEVIPRDTKFPGFTNLLIMPNVGASMRFFLSKWLTVNVGIRDYVFYDHFEPKNRTDVMYATASDAKDHADGSLINNVMFQIGISFWLPPTFEYTTFR